jgi:PAS domain S-box-containing protein
MSLKKIQPKQVVNKKPHKKLSNNSELKQQQSNYQNLLDASPTAYLIHKNGIIIFCNKALLKLLEVNNQKQVIGKKAVNFLIKEDRKKAEKRIIEVYSGIDVNKSNNYKIINLNKKIIEAELQSIVMKFNNENYLLTLIKNITEEKLKQKQKLKSELIKTKNNLLNKEIKERKIIEKKLLEKTAQLTSVFENSDHLIWTINQNFLISSYNQNYFNSVFQTRHIKIYPNYDIHNFSSKRKKDPESIFWINKYKEAFSGKKLDFEIEHTINNIKYFGKVYINPVFNETNEVTELSCIANDITEIKLAQQKTINQAAKLKSIFESSYHYLWTIDCDKKLTSFNNNYCELVSAIYNTKPRIGITINRGALTNNNKYIQVINKNYDLAFNGQAASFEIETIDKTKKKIYLDVFLNPIKENNKIVEVSGIAYNITDKKINQQKIEQALKEKEVLLKEVHHRVKNNMQIISSILNLQAAHLKEESTINLLKKCQNRINTMAFVHESLYQNKSLTEINFSKYINSLAKNLFQSFSDSSSKIKLLLNLNDINLNLDSSIPAGLIINELITNAIKHAFLTANEGEICLNLYNKNGKMYFIIKDNGIGLPENFDIKTTKTLGLQLVLALINQLGAEIKFKSQSQIGTEVSFSF